MGSFPVFLFLFLEGIPQIQQALPQALTLLIFSDQVISESLFIQFQWVLSFNYCTWLQIVSHLMLVILN